MGKSTIKKTISGLLLILSAVSALLPAFVVGSVGMSGVDILKTGLGGSAPEAFGFYQETLSAHMMPAAVVMLAALICPVILGLMTCVMKNPKGAKTGMIGAVISIILFVAVLVTGRMGLTHMAGLLAAWGSELSFMPGIAACAVKILLCLTAAVLAKMEADAAEDDDDDYEHDFGMTDNDVVVDTIDGEIPGYYKTVKVKKTTPAQSGITEMPMTEAAEQEKQASADRIDIPKPVTKKPAQKPDIKKAVIIPATASEQAAADKIDLPKPAQKRPAAKPGLAQTVITPAAEPAGKAARGIMAGIDKESGHVIKLNGASAAGLLYDGQKVDIGVISDPNCVCIISYDAENTEYILQPLSTEMIFYRKMKLPTTRKYTIPAGKNIYIGNETHTFRLM